MAYLPKRNVIYARAESTFDTNPSAAGTSFVYLPCETLSLIEDSQEILPTNYQTGRGYRTAHEAGALGWGLTMRLPLFGLLTRAGVGVSASTISDDYLDLILDHIFGAHANTTGVGLSSGTAAAGTIVADSSGFTLQQAIMMAYSSGLTRASHHQITAVGSAPTYSVVPNVFETITTNWEAPGAHVWQPTLGLATSLAFHFRNDSDWYSLTGGKVTAAKISCEVNKTYMLDLTIRGVTKATESAPGSLVSAVPPTRARLRHSRAPVHFGTTLLDNAGWELDFGIQAEQVLQSSAAEGRNSDETVTINPVLTLSPMWSSTIEAWRSSATQDELMLGLGSGILASSQTPAMSIAFPNMQVEANGATDKSERVHHDLRFVLADLIEVSSTSSRVMTISRF
jgi:hypothetical protein